MIRSQLIAYSGNDPIWGFVALVGSERFTGEAAVGLDPRVHLYALEGRVYYAEREGDAPVGTRLVNCGAITPEQLQLGSVALGDGPSLARLFQRQPLIDRDTVELTIERATDMLLESVADRPVAMPEVFPLRHHPAGIHHWARSPIPTGVVPVDTLSAEPDLTPLTAAPVVEPVVEHVPEPVVEHVPEPVVEHVPEPVVEHVPEPVVEHVPEPVVEHVPEPVVEYVPEPEPVAPPAPVFAPLGLMPLSTLAPLTPEPVVEYAPEPVVVSEPEPVVSPDPVVVSAPEPVPDLSPVTALGSLSTFTALTELTPLDSPAFLSAIGADTGAPVAREATPEAVLEPLTDLVPLPGTPVTDEPGPGSLTPDLPRLANMPISVKDMDTGSVAIIPGGLTPATEPAPDAPATPGSTNIWDLLDHALVDPAATNASAAPAASAQPAAEPAPADQPDQPGRGWLRSRKG